MVKPYWPRLALAMFSMVLVGGTAGALAWLVKPAMDDVFQMTRPADLAFFSPVRFLWGTGNAFDGLPEPTGGNIALILIPIAIVGVYSIKGGFSYVYNYMMNWVGQRIVTNMRNQLYEHMQTLSLSFFDESRTGDLMSRLVSDVHRIQNAVSSAVTGVLKDGFSIIVLVFVVFYRSWELSLIAMVVFPLAVIPIVKLGQALRKIASRHQVTMGNLSALIQETISGHRIVAAFGMEKYEVGRFNQESERLFRLGMRNIMVKAMSSPIMEFLGGIAAALIVYYGGLQVLRGHSTPGTFFSFMAAMMLLYEPVKRLSGLNHAVQEGLASAERIYEILDTKPEITDATGARELPPIKRSIEFKDVHFAYNAEPVLGGIDLTVTAGEIVAIVGVSGAGKTTLVNLIPRFYEVSRGGIYVDGFDIREVTVASLRSQIGMVTQQTILFNDTVRHNIAYGDQSRTEDQIVAAAQAAYAHDFIMELPEGYETVIGESGVRLSGGERQRLSIARALLKDAPILVLDEATSSLDTESELYVQKALANLMKNRTTLVIAHRLSTVRHADRIVVLADGRIVEQGRHDDLLAKGGEYTKLYELQFKVAAAADGAIQQSADDRPSPAGEAAS
jgi:subfamily B ATP-binding cassette protein MsbA